jgi:hypothetical protein
MLHDSVCSLVSDMAAVSGVVDALRVLSLRAQKCKETVVRSTVASREELVRSPCVATPCLLVVVAPLMPLRHSLFNAQKRASLELDSLTDRLQATQNNAAHVEAEKSVLQRQLNVRRVSMYRDVFSF